MTVLQKLEIAELPICTTEDYRTLKHIVEVKSNITQNKNVVIRRTSDSSCHRTYGDGMHVFFGIVNNFDHDITIESEAIYHLPSLDLRYEFIRCNPVFGTSVFCYSLARGMACLGGYGELDYLQYERLFQHYWNYWCCLLQSVSKYVFHYSHQAKCRRADHQEKN
mmetsp:Transcript_3601/g.5319  ORF Transcript_3601/g.5319 Transcript_3601/m.5319 type:complete len:165 (+) Transcript_3601:18-512(+)